MQGLELVQRVVNKAQADMPELNGIEVKKTLFRINRDIRFSKNKDPYKTNFGASIVPGGKNSGNPGYYIHIKPGDCFVGGGIYQPSPDALKKIRQEIDYNGDRLMQIIGRTVFKKLYKEPYAVDRLKTAPKGYPKDHEYLSLLQLKHIVFMQPITNEKVVKDGFVDHVVDSFLTLRPFNHFLQESLD
mgnify:CR=1 FL=1